MINAYIRSIAWTDHPFIQTCDHQCDTDTDTDNDMLTSNKNRYNYTYIICIFILYNHVTMGQ